MSLRAHFILPDWKFSTKCLYTCFFSENHTGHNLADALHENLQEWGWRRKWVALQHTMQPILSLPSESYGSTALGTIWIWRSPTHLHEQQKTERDIVVRRAFIGLFCRTTLWSAKQINQSTSNTFLKKTFRLQWRSTPLSVPISRMASFHSWSQNMKKTK